MRSLAFALALTLTACGNQPGVVQVQPNQALIVCDSYAISLNILADLRAGDILPAEAVSVVEAARPVLNDFCDDASPPASVDAFAVAQQHLARLLALVKEFQS